MPIRRTKEQDQTSLHNIPLVEKPTSEQRQTAQLPQDEVPDGGFSAYLQVFGAFFLLFNSWGIVTSFGTFQEYYESAILEHESSSAISWVGTVQGFLLLLVGILTGPIFDRGYVRHLVLAGTFFIVFGMMMTSLSTSYYQIFLAQGVCVGLGAGCLFVPSVAIITMYFDSKRAFMIGMASAGTSIGSVVYPIVFRKLEPSLGFPWATRIVGFIALGTLSISLSIMRMRTEPPKKARALLDIKAFREAEFTTFSLGLFFNWVGIYFPFYYISIYGSRIVGIPGDVSFYLLPAINAGSFFGRIFPGLLADKIGPLNTLIPSGIATAILSFAWLRITNASGLWVFAVLYGFASGAIVTLIQTVLTVLSPDMSVVGTRPGMSLTCAGFGVLIGNPIAGAILDIPQGSFRGAQIFSAATNMAGAVAYVLVRVLVMKQRKGWKA